MNGQIIDHGQNNLTISIDGKPVHLRKTLHQVERFGDLSKKVSPEEPKDESVSDRMKRNHEYNLDIAEIALNPVPNETPWPRDAINAKLDMDKVELLVQAWLSKFFAPRMEKDPRLAVQEK